MRSAMSRLGDPSSETSVSEEWFDTVSPDSLVLVRIGPSPINEGCSPKKPRSPQKSLKDDCTEPFAVTFDSS